MKQRLGPVLVICALGWVVTSVGPATHAQPDLAGGDPVVRWIRRTAQPFDTCQPRDDHRDLVSLRRIVGDAHVVALGEGTVGTREFVQLKQRIVEYLASEMGFTTLAIQANMPEVRRLNDYVMTGRGDPRALISGLKFWPLNTEEMLEFVEWMHHFEASGRGRLQIVGFDMIKADVPVEIVRGFLQHVDPAWADSVESLAGAMLRARQARARAVVAKAEFPTKAAVGHHVRFSGWIRTRDVSDYAGLWWRADAEGGTVAFDNMEHQHVAGTQGWQRYALELDVPAHADTIAFGALMVGTGAAWFDSLAIEIDGRPWTDAGRLGLSMESADKPVGFTLDPAPGYSIRMDDSVAAVGRWSLRLSSVKDFVPSDPTRQWAAVEHSARRIVGRFESEGRRYRRESSADEVEWAERNAQLILQRAGFYRGDSVRDSSMAANIEWIMGRLPTHSKIVLWAYNDNVARTPGAMGDWLAKRLGTDMVVFGLAAGEGQCTTTKTNSNFLEAYDIQPGPEGSFEALARASGIPRFLLDLRRTERGSGIAARLAGGLTMRAIGPVTPTREFWPSAVSREYDVIAWIQQTQATRPLELH
jgi:erythromycin esterase-like protein